MSNSTSNIDAEFVGKKQRSMYDTLRGKIASADTAEKIKHAIDDLSFLGSAVADDLEKVVALIRETVLDDDENARALLKAKRDEIADLDSDIDDLTAAAKHRLDELQARELENWAKSLAADIEKHVDEQVSILGEAGTLLQKLQDLGARYDELFKTVNDKNNQLRAEEHEDLCVRPVSHRFREVAGDVPLATPASCINQQNAQWLIAKVKAAKAGSVS